jgi:uncharacterized lipoprotein YmbA
MQMQYHIMNKFLPLFLLVATLFSGCRSTTKIRIFLLTPDESLQRLNSTNVKFELRPITLPNYLSRREFVKRIGEDELQIQRSWLWAETSERSINAAFEQNLKALLGEDNVLPYGTAKSGTPVLFISVNHLEVHDDTFVADFHCRLKAAGKATLEKRIFWKTAVESDVPYIKYYKQAMAEMARQTAAWLVETQN